LIDEGLATSTPVSRLAAVSRKDELALARRLGDPASGRIAASFEAPVPIGIGQVLEALMAVEVASPQSDLLGQTG
jgi:hypothetical protein